MKKFIGKILLKLSFTIKNVVYNYFPEGDPSFSRKKEWDLYKKKQAEADKRDLIWKDNVTQYPEYLKKKAALEEKWQKELLDLNTDQQEIVNNYLKSPVEVKPATPDPEMILTTSNLEKFNHGYKKTTPVYVDDAVYSAKDLKGLIKE